MKINYSDSNPSYVKNHEVGKLYTMSFDIDDSPSVYILCVNEDDGTYMFVNLAHGSVCGKAYKSLEEVDKNNVKDFELEYEFIAKGFRE